MALTTSLISFWQLNETTGNRSDAHGTNTLIDNGSVASITGGIVSRAAVFASGNSLRCADNTSLSVGNIDFTCAGWLYYTTTSAVTAYVLGHWDEGSGNQRSWLLNQYTDSKIYLTVSSDGTAANTTFVTGPTLSAETFYFFVCGYDAGGDVAFLQIDNGTYNTAAWSTGVFDSSASFALGTAFTNGTPTTSLNGGLDQIGFWKRKLTDPEKTWLYNAGAGRSYADIVAESAASTEILGAQILM